MTFATVALVLTPAEYSLLEALSAAMPTWIGLREPELARPSTSGQLTSFAVKHGETVEDAARRIVYSLDEHHSEVSQKPGYKYLIVFGCRIDSALKKALEELGFAKFCTTEFGFVATKQ